MIPIVRDLSLHLLDLVQNSITAGASLVTIRLTLEENGMLTMVLADNGKGMSPELLSRVTSPFATTRTTRKVGLGIPMMKENAEKAGGTFQLESEEGKGTTLTCTMDTGNIDCLPLGDLSGTLLRISSLRAKARKERGPLIRGKSDRRWAAISHSTSLPWPPG